MRKTLAVFVALFLLHAFPAFGQDARDTVLATRIRANCTTVSGWRTGQQTSTVRAALASCVAASDSLKLKRIVTPPPPTNQAPVAVLKVTCDSLRKCVASSSGSTDDKGIVGYAWSFGDGAVSTAIGSAQHTYAVYGTFTASLTVRDLEGLASTATQTVTLTAPIVVVPPSDTGVTPVPVPQPLPTDTARFAGAAELPRVTPNFIVPAPIRSYVVSGNLQTALDTARAGDEIRLKPGIYTGSFRWPQVCTMGRWLTLRSDVSDATLGAYATLSDTSRYARIVVQTSEWAMRIDGPVCNVQLKALSFSVTDAPSVNYGVVWLGNGGWVAGGEMQTTLASVPQNILLDHVVIFGTTNANTRRCLALNSGATVITHSWFSGCHAIGDDSQAIATWNGPGPWLIEDNYLEAAGENFIAGGADAGIPNLIPSDITIRRNHFYKPLAWKTAGWQIKNLFELKNAQRVLVEGNVFQHSWPAAQEGWAFILASINQGGTVAGSYATVRDVTVRWNTVDDANHAIAVAPSNNYAGAGATPAQNITVSDNRWSNITEKTFVVNGAMSGVTFARNTSAASRAWFQIGSQNGADRFPGLSVTGNRGGPAVYTLNSPLGDNEKMFSAYQIPLTAFVGNCVALTADQVPYITSAKLPGNTFVSTQTSCPTTSGVDATKLAQFTSVVARTPPVALAPKLRPRSTRALTDFERARRAHQPVGTARLP